MIDGAVPASVERCVVVDQTACRVWEYLCDYRSSEEWDPDTVSAERTGGDGGVGTAYRSVARFDGLQLTIAYLVTGFHACRHLALDGRAVGLRVHEEISLEPASDHATRVRWQSSYDTDPGPVRRRFGPRDLDRRADVTAASLLDSLRNL